MTDMNQNTGFPGDKPKLPGSINVLTILTFIGCGLGVLFSFAMPAMMQWSLKMMDKAQEGGQATEKQLADMAQSRIGIEKMLDNKWPIMLITFVGIALCLYGAVTMRKLKKEGFYVYVIGEIAPLIASVLLLGFSVQFNGVVSYILGIGIPLLFVILYSTNLKYLK